MTSFARRALYCALPAALMAGAFADESAATVTFSPNADIYEQVQEAFILAEPGTVFEFEEGVYKFPNELSLTVDGVTIRGKGMDKTVFSFRDQDAGAEGLLITSDNVTLEDFAVEDTKGDAVKSVGANNIIYRRIRAEWTDGPNAANGAYGLYPVSSKNVLIEECVAIGASDAGIYVGQSENIIVRRSRAEYNVAGIEIENSYHADVYENTVTNNTGGILVFDLPGLPKQGGRDVRVFNNRVYDNNTRNFAPPGNIVGTVPAGTGVMVMANSRVEIFDNDIRDHQTNNVAFVSYYVTGLEIKDPNYYPYPEAIHFHNNTLGRGGYDPQGEVGLMAVLLAGSPLPDIVWDGIVNEEKLEDGALPEQYRIFIHSNTKEDGDLGFVNLDARRALEDPTSAQVSRDLEPHKGALPRLEPVVLPHVD